jgi:hypothetical protein
MAKVKKIEQDLKALTLDELIVILQNTRIAQGKNLKLLLSSDEEGNSFSPVCLRGMEVNPTDETLYIYPLFPLTT